MERVQLDQLSAFTIIVPVGPGEQELERLADLRSSVIAGTEGEAFATVLVDDSPTARRLDAVWNGASVVRTPIWGSRRPDPYSAQVAGTIEALKLAQGEFALKLDTDAVVIAPFAEALRRRFSENPRIGIAGAYDTTPNGDTRDWSQWPRMIRRAAKPLRIFPSPGPIPRLGWRRRSDRSVVRQTIARAVLNPTYALGAHCLGGAYAVSERLMGRAASWDWRPWIGSGLGEDVVLGLLCAATGLEAVGMVSNGDPFGVTWRGLPASPETLVRRGFSVVHSVKDCEYGTEQALRDWFRDHARPAMSGR